MQAPTDPLRAFGLATPGQQASPPPEILEQLQRGNASPLRQQGNALRKRLDARPGDTHLMHALATVTFHEGRRDEAMRLWATTSKADPNLPSAELMAELQALYVAFAARDASAAQRLLPQLEKRFASDPHFQLTLAEQAMRGGNVAAAEKAYRQAVQLGPRLWVTRVNLGVFLDRVRKDADGAGQQLREATQLAGRRAEPWMLLADHQMRQNQADAALASMRRARDADPAIGMPERRLGDLAASLQRHEDARRLYTAALQGKPTPNEALAVRVALGDVLLRMNRLDEARRELEAVVKVQPIVPVVFALGTVDEAQGRNDAAERRYREVLKLQPGQPLAANNLAMLLIRRGNKAPEALTLAEQARKSLPNNAIVESTWGCALVENQRGADALPVLQAVAKAQPQGDVWTHYCLGKALLASQQPQPAGEQLRLVLQIDPQFTRRDEVARLLGTPR